ncbi:hypothetical protein ABZY57_29150 [Streptomyces sp. NPDC006450]|uniref:hypothetical protein n=1 Tax=Streptomyces sp. NPDC006450 TaxID=3155458 RepID=UPI0033BB98F6
MNTLLDYLVVLAVAALLLGPALYGTARERRLDRQIRAARQADRPPRHQHRPARTRTLRMAVRHAPGR